METSPEEQEKKPASEKKPPQQGGNFVWYLLGLGLVLLLLVTLLGGTAETKITPPDFKKLVEASDPQDPEKSGSIEIVDRSTTPPRKLRLSNLTDIVVDETNVTGRVDRQVLPAEGSQAATLESLTPPSENVRFRVSRNFNGPQIEPLLEESHLPYDNAAERNPAMDWVPTLVMMIAFGALLFLMLRRMGGAGSPMAFGRSKAKLHAQEDLDITFDDVAGIEEAVDELREVVDFLKNPERYQRLGGRIPKGVLLVGPPGTGKTLLSKAVAGEAEVPFFSLSGSDFVEMFVGVGAARVRDMFQQAEQRAPCIVFIDELDALGKTRGGGAMGSHDEREQTLNALLVEMDGFGTNSGIIVMAATNRPETLDPALMRPGRFDRHVLVDRPDVSGREEILEVHLQKIKVDGDVDVKSLAAITSGFVGADLANMVNEAALLAARNGKELVGNEEFYEAVERASIGLEKKSRIILDDEKQRLAYHEAGHALVAYSLPNTDPVHKVSIIPRGLSALGYMQQRPEHDRYMMTRAQLESRIQVMLGGTLAEELILDDVGTGASNDLERATEVARGMVMDYGMSRLGRVNYRENNRSFIPGSEGGGMQHHSEQTAREIDLEVKRIIDENLEKTRRILAARRPALEAITAALLEHEVIDAEHLTKLIDESSPNPRLAPGTDVERKPATPAADAPPKSEGEAAES
ncbi:ATP-dependent zinc metalloprotease FtsH 4 [Pseudobythopirellula maris]|uniref:ATP-dependent zinc metalloprotease FtsH n=1 Tax=Pseudobythopirellula maris TaxID=2527991 RepID=A0A5C5ZL76_9BACT|nr:ATP-dependent zinc metalloprotease FtsH [Pseudobythopirellula maris]TWT88149.1 ATP-dependent zinc metalloprotease FtsH 4 [Pseudobythopirellula maris]